MLSRSKHSSACSACQSPLSHREGVYNRALGSARNWRCLKCLAIEKGRTPKDLELILLNHIARRACLSAELRDPSPATVPEGPLKRGFDPGSLEQVERYSRQLMLPQVGDEGQSRLSRGRVLVVGAGGLGSPAALYLAAAGVGTLAIADPDRVEVSNLQRQILHGTPDLGAPKAESARRHLSLLNPTIHVEGLALRVDDSNAPQLVSDYDVVIDGSDTLTTRHALNRACLERRRPWVHGAVLQSYGHATVFAAGGRPCYRCLFPEGQEAGPTCQSAGVMGAITGVIGAVQALEAIKLLLGEKSPLVGTLWAWDGWTMAVDQLSYQADPKCPVCGPSRRTSRRGS